MNVLSVVLIIALGTALLAALIVFIDLDLAVIEAGQVLRERWVSGERPPESRSGVAAPPEPAVPPFSFREPPSTAADEWLAAAAAHQLADYRRMDRTRPDERPDELVATPLRDVLAARRNDREIDTAA